MPNLTSTEILKAVAKTTGKFAEPEFREGNNTTARLLFSNEAQVFKNVNALKQSLVQPTEAILMARTSQALGTNKEANHAAGAYEDSFVKPITYVQSQRKFKVSYKLAENNRFGYDEQLQTAMLNAMQDMRKQINTYSLAQLAATKMQNGNATPLMGWSTPNFAFENANAQGEKDLLASNMKSVFRKFNYDSNIDVVAGQKMTRQLLHGAQQGSANDENLAYQFGGITLVEEAEIDETAIGYTGGFSYAWQKGTVGMTSWNEGKNRNPASDNDVNGNTGLFGIINDPIIPGLSYDLHVKRGLSDTVLGGGSPHTFFQDTVDEYEITAFYCFDHALLNTANESPNFAFGQL